MAVAVDEDATWSDDLRVYLRPEATMSHANGAYELDRFVIAQNIERYRRLLENTTDALERQRIAKLLREEEAKVTSDSS